MFGSMLKRSAVSNRSACVAGGVLMAGVLASSASAADITQTIGNEDWNNAIWGSPAAAPTAGNNYFTAAGISGDRVRIAADGGSSVFGGDSLTVVAGTEALSKQTGTSTATINGNLTLAGELEFGPNSTSPQATPTLDVADFVVTGDTALINVGRYVSVATIDGTLTGAGALTLALGNASTDDPYDQYVRFTNVDAYTGALTVTESVGIEFGTDYTFSNTFTLQDAGSFLIVNDAQTLTFAQGSLVDAVNGAVAPGTYTGASLDALGANYRNLGGTVVVVPEPASLALLGLGGALMLGRRARA